MARFDRYVLGQLLAMFGFASVVLVLIYWINRAIRLFDWLIASGQSATVFLEFTALTLPNVIRIVLPIGAFVAAVFVTNRMSSESELVVAQSAGMGPFRLARPVLAFGLLVAGAVGLLVHLAVPASFARLAEREGEVAENVTARLLVEGQFTHPAEGLTLYIRRIAGSGQLVDLYLDDRRAPGRPVTYTARRAQLLRTATGPRLEMFDGIAQRYASDRRALSITRFDALALDVAALIPGTQAATGRRNVRAAPTFELLRAAPDAVAGMRLPPERLRAEGHGRIAQSLLALAVPLIGHAMLVIGGFSRFGVWNYIFAAIVAIVLLWLADNAVADAAGRLPGGWPLVYLPGLAGIAAAAGLLAIASGAMQRPRRTPAGARAAA